MRVSDYLPQFKRWLEYRGLSSSSIGSYQKEIKTFIKDIGDLKVKKIRKEHLVKWTILLRKRAQNGYITNCLWAMRSFLKFLKEEGVKAYNFEDFLIPKRKRPEYIEYLENKEIKKILGKIPLNDVHGIRLRAYLELLLNTGMRPSEALSLNREDIKSREIEIIGKGKKKRKIYFNGRVLYWLRKYLNMRDDNDLALFTTHCYPHRLALRTIEGDFEKFIKNIHLKKKITLYITRHCYATNLLRHGCPTEYTQRLLGHSKPDTTRIYYLSIAQKDVKSAHFKYLSYSD